MKRPLFHFIGGMIFPVLYYFLEKGTMLVVLGTILFFILVFEISRKKYPAFNEWIIRYFGGFLKDKEKVSITAMPYFVGGALVAVALFAKPVAITSLLFLTFGDVSAAVFGKRFGSSKLFGLKTLEGSLAFFVIVTIVGFILKTCVFPEYLTTQAVLVSALISAIIEALPLLIDDNLTVPICAGFILQIMN